MVFSIFSKNFKFQILDSQSLQKMDAFQSN